MKTIFKGGQYLNVDHFQYSCDTDITISGERENSLGGRGVMAKLSLYNWKHITISLERMNLI